MRGLILNVLLAVVWALFSGEFSLREIVVGFGLGFALLAAFPRALGSQNYLRGSRGLLGFAWFFVRELTVANVQVALLALRPHPPLNGMIFAVPLRLRSDLGQTLLTALVTLMPGSVVLGFSSDRRTMYVHAIGLPDTRAARQSVVRVEDALLRVLPGAATPAAPTSPPPSEVRP